MRPPRFLVLPLFVLAACGATGNTQPAIDFTGTAGQPIAATNVDDVLVVEVKVDGVDGTAVVDTGSPIVLLDPSAFLDAGLPNGAGVVGFLTTGTLTFPNLVVVGANLISSPDPTLPIEGSLGCGVLCAFLVSLDYRASTVTLGASSPPASVANPSTNVPFMLEGGGAATLDGVPGTVFLPPSRIMVNATIEGTVYPFLVDTGSSYVTLRESIFTALVKDGRTEIGDIATATVGMTSASAIARLRSVIVGGEEVQGAVGATDADLEATLDLVASETGQEVDGLIGGSFLRQFYVTIDYPNATLELRRYTEGGPTFDSFDCIGLAVEPANGATLATVTEVFAGTHAAMSGVAAGDIIVAIEGQLLAPLGTTAIDTLLSGPVGSTKTVSFGSASSPTLSMKTVSLAVDDILPL